MLGVIVLGVEQEEVFSRIRSVFFDSLQMEALMALLYVYKLTNRFNLKVFIIK